MRLVDQPGRPDLAVKLAKNPVDAMLAKLGLSAYAATLAREDVTLATLKVMTDDDLAELGLPKGPRVQLLAWAKQ